MNLLRVICLSLAFALSPPVIMMAPLVLVAPVRASPVALPLASTAMPESRFKFSCGRTFGTCGVHYCEDSYEDPYAQPFYGMSSTDSLYQNYNLASLLRSKEASELKGFCIDKSLLANPDASYDINQLHGEGFWGVVKMVLVPTGEVLYLPLEADGLLMDKENNSKDEQEVKYLVEMSLIDRSRRGEFFDTRYGSPVTSWMWFNLVMTSYIRDSSRLQEASADQAYQAYPYVYGERANLMGRSDLELILTPDEYYGKDIVVYDALLSGSFTLPDGDVVQGLKLESRGIRFPKYGFDNFRKNKRDTKGVSFVPSSDSQLEGSFGRFRFVELVIMFKRKP